MTDHLVSLERYLRDAFAQRQQAVGLFFDLEKAYETTWQYGIIRALHRIGLRGRLPVFVSDYLKRPANPSKNWDNTLMNSSQRKVFQLAVSWLWHVLDWRLMSCPLVLPRTYSKHFVDDLAICFRGRSLDTTERHVQQAVNAIQEWATRNGFRFAAHKCKVVHFTAPRSRAQTPPIVRIGNTPASGGVHEVPRAVVGLQPLI